MELTLQNVTTFSGGEGTEISVHFLRSWDTYTYGMCFKKTGTNTCEVLWYGPRDTRSAVSCLLPPSGMLYSQEVDRLWDTRAVVRKEKCLDHSLWSESAYMYTVTPGQYLSYQKWLVEWVSSACEYSLIEGGATSRVFMTASIDHFSQVGKPVHILKQCVVTLDLSYELKEPVSVVDMSEVSAWYRVAYDNLSGSVYVNDVVGYINGKCSMYYRERINGVTKLWKLQGVKIRPNSAPLHHVESYSLQVARVEIVPQQILTQDTNSLAPIAPPVVQPLPIAPDRRNLVIIIVLVVVMVIIIMLIVVYVWHSSSVGQPALIMI